MDDALAVWDGQTLEDGFLVCDSCAERFQVRAGIPRLLKLSNGFLPRHQAQTAEHFRNEFTAFAEDDLDSDPPELDEYYFLTRTGIDPRVFEASPGDPYRTEMGPVTEAFEADYGLVEEKTLLDAGCGTGRFVRVAASKADLVVGLDIGDHIDRAASLCRELDNVEFVQGSVLAPPFKEGCFDFIFSVGVLHHTPDPGGGVQALARAVAPGGHLSIWVYPPGYWNGPIRGATGRVIHAFVSRLSSRAAWFFCARILYPIGRVQMFLARRRWTKLLFAPLFILSIPRHPRRAVMISTIYDYYGPRIISTHTYDEVEWWFRDAGLTELRRSPLPTGIVARKA